jgi:hypothetical protein
MARSKVAIAAVGTEVAKNCENYVLLSCCYAGFEYRAIAKFRSTMVVAALLVIGSSLLQARILRSE